MRSARIILIPFGIGASFHYLGSWAGVPALFVFGLWWIGDLILLSREGKQ